MLYNRNYMDQMQIYNRAKLISKHLNLSMLLKEWLLLFLMTFFGILYLWKAKKMDPVRATLHS